MSITFLTSILSDSIQQIELKRNQVLCAIGEQEQHLWYVEKGAIRAFVIIDGEEQDIRFGYDGSFISSAQSFFSSKPSEFSLEAIKKTKVYKIKKTSLLLALDNNPELANWWRLTLENLIVQQIEREIDLLHPKPADRYRRVLSRSPQLFQHIPLKYIASYLRMSPETLSRLRKS